MFGNLFQSAVAADPVLVRPDQKVFWLKLKLLAPLAHGDPGQADKSNVNLFRRQKKSLPTASTGRLPSQAEVDKVCELFPVPADIAAFFQEISLPQFVGVAVLRLFVEAYGTGEGQGLFSGMERYRRLEERFQQSALRAHTLFDMWSIACQELMVAVSDKEDDRLLLSILTLPSAVGALVLHELATQPRVLVLLAREWANTRKNQSAEYAAKAQVPQANAENVRMQYDTSSIKGSDEVVRLQLPTFSGNSARHEIVREPGGWHLFNRLGIHWNTLPSGVKAIFENGNNIEGGAKEPSNSYALSQLITEAFPLLGLVSGSADDWILGTGNLSAVNSWVVCKENNDALELAGIQSRHSIFDMLDMWTSTRHAGRSGKGQMPFTTEVLNPGDEIAVRLALSPYVRPLEVGALLAAVETYMRMDNTLGGGAARHFGLVKAEWLHEPDEDDYTCKADYEEYLATNREALHHHLVMGTLGTDKPVCR